ncbi:hypothetical protein BDM02DRAFT_3108719 [Thelephora ganbajun]|uniref:Uncharacterized protein n=1 Tax=Thelephora ganbajun TaxID=370292 RepID=A0ACB6ZSR2_THEGA|nr:hypothetical protein BDM02DRAFT_3108719 [Thelephora ganbajun]
MPDLNGVQVTIASNGQPLEEYEATYEGDTVTCWIPSEVGKTFEIRWRVQPGLPLHNVHRVFDCYMDGRGMKRALGKPSHRSGSIVGVSTGATTLRPFTFSTIQLTEEEDGLSSKASTDLSHLGTIIVKAHRAKHWSTLPYIDKLRTSPSELPTVNEKSKKAASHCISLGAQRTQKSRPRAHGVELLGKSPVATFIFRYASKDMLQAQGIIPKRRPSVTTNTHDRPSLSMNDPTKGDRRTKRRSITKEPSIVRRCENAIQRDEVTRLRKQVKDLKRRLREAEKVKQEDIKPAIRTAPEVIDLTQ